MDAPQPFTSVPSAAAHGPGSGLHSQPTHSGISFFGDDVEDCEEGLLLPVVAIIAHIIGFCYFLMYVYHVYAILWRLKDTRISHGI